MRHFKTASLPSIVALSSLLVLIIRVDGSSCFVPHHRMIDQRQRRHQRLQQQLFHKKDNDDDEHYPNNNKIYDDDKSSILQQTRNVLLSTLSVSTLFLSITTTLVLLPLPSNAGEVGAKITKAVTQSDLGISVRTSVVKGAQIMDSIDGRWEQFSDNFGLGSQRQKQPSRPQPKIIPALESLNTKQAQSVLDISDQSFVDVTGMSPSKLQKEIQDVSQKVRISFERSGDLDKNSDYDDVETGFTKTPREYNFLMYVHYKAYSNLLLQLEQQQQQSQQTPKTYNFNTFRTNYEKLVGRRLIDEFKLSTKTSTNNKIDNAIQQITTLGDILRQNGFIASMEVSKSTINSSIDDDDPVDETEFVNDFMDGSSQVNIAVDGDITLNSQLLLQEQGYRLYPNYIRFVTKQLFQDAIVGNNKVSVLDYYLDTDYNSDPNKFEVKEVLLSVTIDND
jgi:hypothetical protein